MLARAAAIFSAEDSMRDNVSGFFDAIFGIVDDFSEIGAGWGEPWDWLLPVLVAIALALAIVAGFGHIFAVTSDKVRPILMFVLLIVGFLALAAIRGTDENTMAPVLSMVAQT